ncbi:MAG: pilus assembly protein N-terminal domain-containing protein, partial [Pseudomonadota bacterium]
MLRVSKTLTAIGLSLITLGSVSLTASAWTEKKVAADAQTLTVERGRSTVIEVQRPFTTIAVADPDIASVTATSDLSFFVRGKTPGWTTVLIYDELGAIQEMIPVSVSIGLDALRNDLATLLPNESIDVHPVHDGIFVSGDISSANAASTAITLAERYVPGGVANGLTVDQSQQVMLEVRFIEINRTIAKEIAIGSSISRAGDFIVNTDGNLINGIAQTAAAVTGLGLGGGVNLDITIQALETNGIARTLARPNLVALSGDTASFLAGGEFPIPVAQGDETLAIEFRDFGVGLEFTPTVLGDDIINLKVVPEVSSLDFANGVNTGGLTVPALSTRRAETTVELRDGQAFAIAGL